MAHRPDRQGPASNDEPDDKQDSGEQRPKDTRQDSTWQGAGDQPVPVQEEEDGAPPIPSPPSASSVDSDYVGDALVRQAENTEPSAGIIQPLRIGRQLYRSDGSSVQGRSPSAPGDVEGALSSTPRRRLSDARATARVNAERNKESSIDDPEDPGEGPSQTSGLFSPRIRSGNTGTHGYDGADDSRRDPPVPTVVAGPIRRLTARQQGKRPVTVQNAPATKQQREETLLGRPPSSTVPKLRLHTRFNDNALPHQTRGVGCSPSYRNPPGRLAVRQQYSPEHSPPPYYSNIRRYRSRSRSQGPSNDEDERAELYVLSDEHESRLQQIVAYAVGRAILWPIYYTARAAAWSAWVLAAPPMLAVRLLEDPVRMLGAHLLLRRDLPHFRMMLQRWHHLTADLPFGSRRPLPIFRWLIPLLSFLLSYWTGRWFGEFAVIDNADSDDEEPSASTGQDDSDHDNDDDDPDQDEPDQDDATQDQHGDDEPGASNAGPSSGSHGTVEECAPETGAADIPSTQAVQVETREIAATDGTEDEDDYPLIPNEQWSEDEWEDEAVNHPEQLEEDEPMPQVNPDPPPPPPPSGGGVCYSMDFANMSVDVGQWDIASIPRDETSEQHLASLEREDAASETFGPITSNDSDEIPLWRRLIDAVGSTLDDTERQWNPAPSPVFPILGACRESISAPSKPTNQLMWRGYEAAVPLADSDVSGITQEVRESGGPAGCSVTEEFRGGTSCISSITQEFDQSSRPAECSTTKEICGDTSCTSTYTVLSASIPGEPDPLRLLTKSSDLLSRIFTPPLPNCQHYPKPAITLAPPPDMHESSELVTPQNHSVTDLGEEAYLTTMQMHIDDQSEYLSRKMAFSLQFAFQVWGDDATIERDLVKGTRDYGLHYLADKIAERLRRRRERGIFEPVPSGPECDSDDDTPRNSFSAEQSEVPLDELFPELTQGEGNGLETTEGMREEDGYASGAEENANQENESHSRTQAGSAPQLLPSPDGSYFHTPWQSTGKEDRRDSAGVRTSSSPTASSSRREAAEVLGEPESASPTTSSAGPLPPSYSQATALAFSATAEDLSTPVEQNEDDSVSTSSSQRARMSFRRQGSKGGAGAGSWRPYQSKSTASVGFSAGQSVVGNLSLRDAVSPTRGKSPALELLSERTGERKRERAQSQPPAVAVEQLGVLPDVLEEPPTLKGILKNAPGPMELSSEGLEGGKRKGKTPWDERRAQLNRELDLKPLRTRPVILATGTNKQATASSSSPSKVAPESSAPGPPSAIGENVSPRKRSVVFEDEVSPLTRHSSPTVKAGSWSFSGQQSAAEASTPMRQMLKPVSPRKSLVAEYKQKRKAGHKRSAAVDLRGIEADGGPRAEGGGCEESESGEVEV